MSTSTQQKLAATHDFADAASPIVLGIILIILVFCFYRIMRR